jgi:hypothetical protein
MQSSLNKFNYIALVPPKKLDYIIHISTSLDFKSKKYIAKFTGDTEKVAFSLPFWYLVLKLNAFTLYAER